MIRVGIIGGSGYTGMELIRLLSNHEFVKISVATSRRLEGRRIEDVHRHLRGFSDLIYEDVDPSKIASRSDVVYTAVPHGSGMRYVPALLENGTRVIDISADYRLPPDEYARIYGRDRNDNYERVYGLSELHPEVKDARLVANPGCYSTGAILAVAPIVKSGLAERIVFDSKSGISGAGIEPTERSHYPNLAENIIAYEVKNHRHKAEIIQELRRLNERPVKVYFTPHVIPCIRGILTTAHVFVNDEVSKEDLRVIYDEFYDGKPFIRVGDIPSIGSVRGTNFCDIGFEVDGDRIIVVSSIDNLIKGASGQAIQNMNLMFGIDERSGLWFPGLFP
jgi:N-acetyl-gamma-glutamyl-phosphate reductase